MSRLALFACAVALALTCSNASAHSPSAQDIHTHAERSPSAWMQGYTLILVDADSKAQLAEARDFITSQGGTIAAVFPPRAIMGWITPDVGQRIIGRHRIHSIHRSALATVPSDFSDRETRLAIRIFNKIASGQRTRAVETLASRSQERDTERPPLRDCSLPSPQIDREAFIRNLQLLGAEKSLNELRSQSSLSPQFLNNSDVMDGTVAVAVFMLESDGTIDPNVYSWTQSERDAAVLKIIEGLNWWVDQSRAFGLGRPLQFTYNFFFPDNPVCQIPYEPVLHSGFDTTTYIESVMNKLGVTQGNIFTRVGAFNRQLKEEMRADWAFSAFIAYNSPTAPTAFTDGRSSWAYIGGPYSMLLYRSFGWDLSQVIIHETGHIFYACDEYSVPGYQVCSCSCAPEVRPQARNGNCQEGSCNLASTACMMRLNEFALCSFTVAQIGWTREVPQQIPEAPTGLVASASSPTQVSLVWQDRSSSEEGFQLERRGGSEGGFLPLTVVPANTTTYSDNTALPNTVYVYRLLAFNGSGASSYSAEAQVVTPSGSTSLAVSTSSLPEATVGVSYSQSLVATGGVPPYTWQPESGSLPNGLALSSAGILSGTPSTSGTYTFVVRVTDVSSSATRALTLVVKPTAALTITTTELPRGSVASTYSQPLGASGGQTPYTWSMQSGRLPDGLQLNPNGIISGTPERPSSSSFVIKVTDSTGVSASSSLAIIINPVAVLSIETESLPDGVVGEKYSQTLKGVGGNQPYRWEIASGSLPQGFTLSESGLIEGDPVTEGESEFTVRLIDQSGQAVTGQLSIDIEAAPQLTILSPGALPVAAVGVPYRIELEATAGSAPYTWIKKKKAKFGLFPDGINLTKEGVLSGTPTRQGTFNFTLRVKDATGRQAGKPFVIEVGPPPPPLAVRTESLPSAAQGLPYSVQLEAGGGVAPYRWNLDFGGLPVGMTLSETGLISGRAVSVGSSVFVVRVQDALGTSSTKQFFITTLPPPPPLVIQTVQLSETSADRPYNQRLQATGGVPPYTWSVASGSLGAGLNLSADGVISGAATAAGNNVFTVRVTDSAQQSVTRTLAIIVAPADRLAPFGIVETPANGVSLALTLSGSGWALDNVEVTRIEILVDGQKVADGVYGGSRPDVAAVWGTFPNARNAGFTFSFDTTRISNGSHTLSVRVLDAAENATILGQRTINIQNRVLAVATTDLPRGVKGQSYSTQLAAINGTPPYQWTVASGSLPPGLSLNASGQISGTPTAFGNFNFTVRVIDATTASATANILLTILPDIEPLRIISQGDLTQGSTGVEYSHQLFFAGGVPPRTWSMNSGSLPAGLALNPVQGTISGTPTIPGVYAFTVRLTDSAPTTVTSQELRITVIPGPLRILSPENLPDGTTGANYSFILQKAGGAPPYTWRLADGALPPGLSFNTSTGTISGKPVEDGDFSFTIELKDAQPVTTSVTFSIHVELGPLVIVSSGDLTTGKRNTPYTHQLVGSGGRAPYVWSIASGALPAGLSLNETTGVISGTPTTLGIATFTVRLTDAASGDVTSNTLRINITP